MGENELDINLYNDEEFRAAMMMWLSSLSNNSENAHSEESPLAPIVKRKNPDDPVTVIGGDNGKVIDLYKQLRRLRTAKRAKPEDNQS